MKRFNFISLMVLFCFSLTVNSCSTSRLGKLDGQWQLFWINNLSDPNIYIWQFEGGELTVVEYSPPTPANPNPQPHVGARAQYKTSAEFLDAVVEISGHVPSVSSANANAMLSNGKWTIDVIDDEVMRLATADQEGSGGSYVIREFSRVN